MKTSFILRELVVHQQKHMETSSKRVHRSALVKKKKGSTEQVVGQLWLHLCVQ